jgi:hypothetical protein
MLDADFDNLSIDFLPGERSGSHDTSKHQLPTIQTSANLGAGVALVEEAGI